MKQSLEEALIIKNLDYHLRDCDTFVVSHKLLYNYTYWSLLLITIANSSLYMLMCVIINIIAFLMAVASTEVVPPHSSLPSLHWALHWIAGKSYHYIHSLGTLVYTLRPEFVTAV